MLAAEVRLRAAADRARELVAAQPVSKEGSARVLLIALAAADVHLILGQPLDFMDDIVKRFVDPEPTLMNVQTDPFLAALGACAVAPAAVAKRCIARLSSLFVRGELGVVFDKVDLALAGARKYVAGDYVGAAATWKPLLRSPDDVLGFLRHPVAIAFDRAGEPDLADMVDAPMLSHPGPFNGADLAYARAARRALKRGQTERARELARKVVDAWSVADERVPVVDEMKAILARPK
jgi:hypothetical protein